MPIYEYVCMECESHFEELVRSSDQAVMCPECGAAMKLDAFGHDVARLDAVDGNAIAGELQRGRHAGDGADDSDGL